MKVFVFIVGFLACRVLAFGQGVNFESLTFDEALAKAKIEKKMVFMDCYTSWCGPCKYMTDNVFPRERMGEFFNPRFVCVKFDMEKGEGRVLAKKFGVTAFPTFFIIRPDGTVQYRIVGGGEPEQFIAKVERGMNKESSRDFLDKLYAEGKTSKKQLMVYLIALLDADEKGKSREVNGKLKAVLEDKDKFEKEYWPIIEREGFGSEDFQFVVNQVAEFRKRIGKKKVDAYLYNNYKTAIDNSLARKSTDAATLLDRIQQELSVVRPEKQELLMKNIELVRAAMRGEVDKVISIVEQVRQEEDKNLWPAPAVSALFCIEPKATKVQLERISALGDRFMEKELSVAGKKYIEFVFERFKSAARTGVYFQKLTYMQAVEKAREQGKKVFVDCYTSWCGSEMLETVFKQEKVGDFLKTNFVCVKYDMEEGEGPALKKKLGVRAYPTFVLVNPDGSILLKIVGGHDGEELIRRIREALECE